MRQQKWNGVIFLLVLLLPFNATAEPAAQAQAVGNSVRAKLIDLTNAALLDQIKCQHDPEVAHAINAMMENRLIHYVDNENGIYVFATNVRLTFLGFEVAYISGFDYEGFKRVPLSMMVGTSPPVFLQIDVVAPVNELRKRALAEGLVEANPPEHKRGFEVSAGSSYLAPKSRVVTSNIQCEVYP